MSKIAPQDMRQHLMLNQARLNTAEDVAQEIEDHWDATEEFSRDESGKQVGKSRDKEHDDGFLKRPERIEQLTCLEFTVAKNAMGECLCVPISSGISGVQASEEPAGTRELKPDQTTKEMLLAKGRRDDGPIVDSGSVVSTESQGKHESGKCVGRIITTLWRQAQCSFHRQKR